MEKLALSLMRKGETEVMKSKKSRLAIPVVVICAILVSVLFFYFVSGDTSSDSNQAPKANVEKELKPGESFETGSYINVDAVKITYNGEDFIIENNGENTVIVSCSFYGAKSDGTYNFIGMPSFNGIDKAQYEKDKAENGWAIEKKTNRVRPNETLVASLYLFDMGDDYPAWDIDEDGYYDINFAISEQKDEDSITVSTADKESDYYKLKAE